MSSILSLFKIKEENKKKIKNTIIKTPLYIQPHLPIPLNYT